MEIVGDQGDGMQVLARRRGRQPLGQDAERIATSSMLRCSASMTASARMGVYASALSAPR